MSQIKAQIRIEGEVFDRTNGQPLPGAQVILLPDSINAVCDDNGFFVLNASENADSLILQVQFVGKTALLYVIYPEKEKKSYHIHLYLNELDCEKCLHTDMVLIEESQLYRQNAQSTVLLNAEFFQENLQNNFSKALEKIPGIKAINVGVGVAKPIIRGLSGNRIIVNQNGIAQQGQQWGNDHGLEIDVLSVDRLEIVKGSGSLLYGSDALGGTINVLPEKISPHNSIKASLQGLYKTNNSQWGLSANINLNYHNWFLQARYSRQEAGDYVIPAENFLYNGFILPIFNNTLKNTAFKEENKQICFGTIQKWGLIKLSVSQYDLSSGIFSGAMGIPRAYELQPDENNRDIDLPSQSVKHIKSILNADFFLPGNQELKLDFGYQFNLRKEFSYAHAHNRLNSNFDGSDLALELNLQTFSANLRYKKIIRNSFSLKSGVTAQYQQNNFSGFDYFLPAFKTLRTGIYAISEYAPNARCKAEGGLRLDYANNSTQSHRQIINIQNLSDTLALFSPATDEFFMNLSASAGIWYSIFPDKWSFAVNLGKSFRVPHPVETVSNGVHHGTFRHEKGSPDLKSEHGYQLDVNTDLNFNDFSMQLSGFANYFNNYIYLSPTARFSTLPDAGQLFQYLQTDAIYSGLELSWNYQFFKLFTFKQGLDYVWNLNLNSGLGLPFSPPASLLNEIRFEKKELSSKIEKLYFELSHRFTFAQNRTDRNEKSTPAYQLFDAALGANFKIGLININLGIQVQNIFNVAYLQHLSRYRLLNLPEQGRNFVFSIKIPLFYNFDK